MPDAPIRVLLDQNIPQECLHWLRGVRPAWIIDHVNTTGLAGQPDAAVFRWAQDHRALIVTFDEDFADARSFPLGAHHGIIRLRVWPTTAELVITALGRVLQNVQAADLASSLVIVDNQRIRLRRAAAP